MKGKREVVTLLERFRRNPEETRRAVRTELGCLKEIAAKVFALVVFVSDGLLASQDKEATLSAVRFFSIAARLPTELQMILCYRVVKSAKEVILCSDSESAFRKLAVPQKFTWEQYLALLDTVPDGENVPSDSPVDFPRMVFGVLFGTFEEQLLATTFFRNFLSQESHTPIADVISCGVIPKLVEFLSYHQYPDLQYEAAWVFTNLTCGTSRETEVVIDAGAVPCFVNLLVSPVRTIREQATWALGNIAGDSPRFRDVVLRCGALPPLLEFLKELVQDPENPLLMVRTATWALSRVCLAEILPPDWTLVSQALPTLSVLLSSTDEDVLTDACLAISDLANGDDQIEAVIGSGVAQRLVELISHKSYQIQRAALRSVGRIAQGTEAQIQALIDAGCLDVLASRFNGFRETLHKDACLIVAGITRTTTQIQAGIKANLIQPLVKVLKGTNFEAKKEAARAILNVTSGGTIEQIMYLVEQGCVDPLLGTTSTQSIHFALDILTNMLKAGEHPMEKGTNLVVRALSATDVAKIKRLEEHENHDIYVKSFHIISTYFS